MDFSCKISVLVVTYNHEKYIKEALESILIQKHSYPYEIIIADDYSTDTTMNIIQEFKGQYPEIIKILPSTGNLGITRNYQRGFEACSGEYVAVLEGDDYWTSPDRLKVMIDFLDHNKGCAFAFNRFIVSELKTKRFNVQPWPINEKFQLMTVADLAYDNMIGNFSTCIYRNENIRKIPHSLYNLKVYDWMFNMVNAQFGLIGYIPEVMSVYRLHSEGTWTQKTQQEKIEEVIKSIDEYDKYFEYKYNAEFQRHKDRLNGTDKSPVYEAISFKAKLKNFVKGYTPPILWVLIKNILPPKLIDWFRTR